MRRRGEVRDEGRDRRRRGEEEECEGEAKVSESEGEGVTGDVGGEEVRKMKVKVEMGPSSIIYTLIFNYECGDRPHVILSCTQRTASRTCKKNTRNVHVHRVCLTHVSIIRSCGVMS